MVVRSLEYCKKALFNPIFEHILEVIRSLEHLKKALFNIILGQMLVVIRSLEWLKKALFSTIFEQILLVIRSLENLKTRLPKDPWELPGHISSEIATLSTSWELFWSPQRSQSQGRRHMLVSKIKPSQTPLGASWVPFPKGFLDFRGPGSLSGTCSG